MAVSYKPLKKPAPLLNAWNVYFQTYRNRLPVVLLEQLKTASQVRMLPEARLLAIALYNELQTENPFNLDLTAEVPFEEEKYINEAGLLYRWLSQFKGGMDLYNIMMNREAEGLGLTETQVLMAIEQLKRSGMIEEFYPTNTKVKIHPDHRYYRCIGMPTLKRKARKKAPKSKDTIKYRRKTQKLKDDDSFSENPLDDIDMELGEE